jgi:hypothetical protein
MRANFVAFDQDRMEYFVGQIRTQFSFCQ